ncbi:hypothetical protein L1987_32442 [Smallanthus sonchifolius]|uniref:Uncharacterized protein n=1 Tax=Smallanthus sonchifolius TaxID=185202 RepID=A0ACB9HP44_9ASTR|nr:hypothetical protein L1987_32442 [Smallanthus sonchifolius]
MTSSMLLLSYPLPQSCSTIKPSPPSPNSLEHKFLHTTSVTESPSLSVYSTLVSAFYVFFHSVVRKEGLSQFRTLIQYLSSFADNR